MKNKNLKIGVVAVLSTVAAAQSCGSRSQKAEQTEDVRINEDSLRLEQRLIELSKTEYTGQLAMGAMCYSTMPHLDTNYICPDCKNTTTYTWSYWDNDYLNAIKQLVSQIGAMGYDAILDETAFCEHCSGKKVEEPELIFKFRFSENADYHIAKSNFESDYRCLLEFLSGNDKFKYSNESEAAIHDKIDIIQKMTGLGKDLKIEKSER